MIRSGGTAILLIPIAFLFPPGVGAQSLFKVEGQVVDAETAQPLPSANIRVVGTGRGTISNREGTYILQVEGGERVVVFSYVGYLSDTLKVELYEDISYDARLKPTLIQLPPLIVSGEDPARGIIRRAIEAKELIRRGLDSYRFQAFTRRTISREDSIAGILENYSYGYWRRGQTLKEQVRQSRKTENLPDIEGLQGVMVIQDFSLDDLELAGNRYIGPLHPNALRWYDYTLVEVRLQDRLEIYRIAMEPRTRVVPLFRGTVEIADSTYALVGVNLAPAERVVFPFVEDLEIEWAQRFQRQEEDYWLPTDIRTNGGVTIGIGPIHIPRIGFNQTSVIYDYDINIILPDSVFERSAQVVELTEASRLDTTFWEQNQVLPLTYEEEHAYSSLDTTRTLESLFAPEGFGMTLGDDSLTLGGSFSGRMTSWLLEGLDMRYNRVEGTHLGFRVAIDSLAGPFGITARTGKGLSADMWSWETRLLYRLGNRPVDRDSPGRLRGTIEIGAYDRVTPSDSAGFYPTFLNSLAAWLTKDDYHDYYISRGWRIDVNLTPRFPDRLDVFFAREIHNSLEVAAQRSLFMRDSVFRPNPPVSIEDELLNRLGAVVTLGRPESEAGLMTGRGISIGVEKGTGNSLGSERTYTRVDGVASYSVSTLTNRFLFSPQLVMRFGGGWSWGALPAQLWNAPENALGIYSPPGALKGADHRELAGTGYAVITAEHNFRSLPFHLLGLDCITNRGLELIVHGGIARAWRDSVRIPAGGPYAEAGIGIGRIADIFRLDLTRRLVEPVGWSLTISLTTFM